MIASVSSVETVNVYVYINNSMGRDSLRVMEGIMTRSMYTYIRDHGSYIASTFRQ